ncbi:Uncharacterised protein [Moraxella ovis]|uniref:Uncharacterized protein n=1 Tax=Moraxella ovis TaxID=29433 RepID=A0A378PLN0_9GAMM|nr:Uncharacterised protein [Moraxella ovis]STY87672.1 Uncharacterised protein [Moraxella ovis]STZ05569.1 Uncharacterised protein [Moraxella ovis]
MVNFYSRPTVLALSIALISHQLMQMTLLQNQKLL